MRKPQTITMPKRVLIQFLALIYNVSNVILYFHTISDYPKDMAFTDKGLFEAPKDFYSWQAGLVAMASLFLLISNQRAYSANFKATLHEGSVPPLQKKSKLRDTESLMSSAYKGLLLSLSMSVFITQRSDAKNNASKSAVIAASVLLFFIPSFISELGVFVKPYIQHQSEKSFGPLRGKTKHPVVVSQVFALLFNVCNVVLYFNNANKMQQKLRISSHPMLDLKNSWDIALLASLSIASVAFFVAQQLSFSKLIQPIISDEVREFKLSPRLKKIENICLYNTVLYKTTVITLGAMVLVLSMSDNWPLTIALGIFSFFGNLAAQYSVFMPVKKQSLINEDVLDNSGSLPNEGTPLIVGGLNEEGKDDQFCEESFRTCFGNC